MMTIVLIITVDDEARSSQKKGLIFQRGTRADTLRPGQGLGLSIAVDSIEQYNGDVTHYR